MGARASRGPRFAQADRDGPVPPATCRRSRHPFLRRFLHAEEDTALAAVSARADHRATRVGLHRHHHPRLPGPGPRSHLVGQAWRPRRLLADPARCRRAHAPRRELPFRRGARRDLDAQNAKLRRQIGELQREALVTQATRNSPTCPRTPRPVAVGRCHTYGHRGSHSAEPFGLHRHRAARQGEHKRRRSRDAGRRKCRARRPGHRGVVVGVHGASRHRRRLVGGCPLRPRGQPRSR